MFLIFFITIQMRYFRILLASLLIPLQGVAQYAVNYEGSVTVAAGSGDFMPYYMSSLEHGRYTSPYAVQAEARAWRPIDTDKRFSYGFGVDVIGGVQSATDYERFIPDTETWTNHSVRPSSLRLQQLYGEVKWRSVFLLAGMKEHSSALQNQRLSSGDLVESGNARPIPEVRAGFLDFQNIPFTNGWVQIQGEIGYGKMMDDGWKKEQYDYYNYHQTLGQWYNYKRCFFRTNPSQPFSVTVGMQAAAMFGGTETYYSNGQPYGRVKYPADLKTFVKMFLPHPDGGEAFYSGNHLGSWDLRGRYLLHNGAEVAAYFSWPWEDGSGIGKQNGWDGLWGLEYKASGKGLLTGAVIEYLDFTNQSGPIHYEAGDYADTTLNGESSGSDDYYNNRAHGSYAYYGQSIGTPALMAPLYNTSGYPAYLANVMRGFHIGLEGSLTPSLDYRLKGGYRKAWGNGIFILPGPISLTAVMAEATWHPARLKGLTVNARVEIDHGTMPCNAFGAMLTVKYNGLLNL